MDKYGLLLVLCLMVYRTQGLGCPVICPMNYAPLCGTDGVTYSNACKLLVRNCKAPLNNRVEEAYEGECQNQRRKNDCPDACPEIFSPVCGTDGVSYSNECKLRLKTCPVSGSSVTVAYTGMCIATKKEEECPENCGFAFDPVCGTDGNTYPNECRIAAANCGKHPPVTVRYQGECKKDCPDICTTDYSPVCGTDGKTYSNKCQLIVENCPKQNDVTVEYKGECRKACPQKSCSLSLARVCGTDGITYGNQCQMEVDNCQKAIVKVAYVGECRANTAAECTSGSRWKTTCNWCRCSYGRPSCTKRRCFPTDNIEPQCVSKSRWRESCGWCECVNGKPSCSNQGCANILNGGNRNVCKEGETWKHECNSCMCSNGRPACTKRLCRSAFGIFK